MATSKFQLSYYGTGLALAEHTLDDGTKVFLRREPQNRKWQASVLLERVKDIAAALAFTDTSSDETHFRVFADSPETALAKMELALAFTN